MNARFPNPMDYLRQLENSTDEPCEDCGWHCTCNDPPGCLHCERDEELNADGLCADCTAPDEQWTVVHGDPLLRRRA